MFLQEDLLKMVVENFLNSKSAEFYLREINKVLNNWQEVF